MAYADALNMIALNKDWLILSSQIHSNPTPQRV